MDAMLSPQPPMDARGASPFGRASAACARNSGLAVAVIVVLVVLVAYLYARVRGWVGREPRAKGIAKAKPKKGKGGGGGGGGDDDASAEIDRLIDELDG